MIHFVIHMLLLGGVIFALAEALPRVRVESYGWALAVAVVYSIANALLFWVLAFLALPLMILTLGLFSLVINAFLLWLTDQLIDAFEIEDLFTTAVMAVLITIANMIIEWLL